jgi:hypothetical protein
MTWKDELGNLVVGSRVSDDFVRRINRCANTTSCALYFYDTTC